jgi:hypothetical protein
MPATGGRAFLWPFGRRELVGMIVQSETVDFPTVDFPK